MEVDADLDEDSLRQDVKRGCYFVDGVEGWGGPRLTARELAMLRLTESITDKPDWDRKVFDDAIVAKWRAEARALPLISEPAWEWVLTEVREKAEAFKSSRRVVALDSTARCAKSDVLVSPELRAELIAGVAPLLSVPDDQKDWHPGSSDQVLNLVHPSLYPLVYGRTRVLTQGGCVDLAGMLASCGKGEVAAQTEHDFSEEQNYARSSRFQWLPCEVEFASGTEEETSVRITSYINNLHPTKHRGLYRTIEKIISLCVPLWNDVVMYEDGVRTPLRIVTYGAEWAPKLPDWAQYQNMPTKTTDENFSDVMEKVKEYLALPDRPGYRPDEAEEDDQDEEDHFDNEQDPEAIVAALEARLARIESNANANQWEFKSALNNVLERKWRRFRYVAHPEPGQSFTYEGKMTPLIEACCRNTTNIDDA
jgi:hypothetical protein